MNLVSESLNCLKRIVSAVFHLRKTNCKFDLIVINKCLKDMTSSAVNMKTITCREAGFECDYVVKGETEEEVMKRGAEHAMKDHGMKEADITPEFKEKVRGLIRTT
jgi:predicted small metal-binding protein